MRLILLQVNIVYATYIKLSSVVIVIWKSIFRKDSISSEILNKFVVLSFLQIFCLFKDKVTAHNILKCKPGADPREGRRGRSPPPPIDGCWPKIETPCRSKVAFIRSRMHQNSPFRAQKSNNFLGRGHNPFLDPSLGGERDTPSPHPNPSPPSAPRSSLLRRLTRHRRLLSPL